MSEHMILDGAVCDTIYRLSEEPDTLPSPGHALPLERWLHLQSEGADLNDVGVILDGDTDPSPIRVHLNALAFVAITFPKFGDGRGYSHARRLRKLWGYEGPIVAFGDVLRDQLHYMQRSGFNGFVMRADQDPKASLEAFKLYSSPYQYNA